MLIGHHSRNAGPLQDRRRHAGVAWKPHAPRIAGRPAGVENHETEALVALEVLGEGHSPCLIAPAIEPFEKEGSEPRSHVIAAMAHEVEDMDRSFEQGSAEF